MICFTVELARANVWGQLLFRSLIKSKEFRSASLTHIEIKKVSRKLTQKLTSINTLFHILVQPRENVRKNTIRQGILPWLLQPKAHDQGPRSSTTPILH